MNSGASILNKQSHAADKGWSSIFGVEQSADNSLFRNVTQDRGLGLILWNDILHRMDKIWKLKFRVGSQKTVASELANYNSDLVAVK
jgi:hypothetical protein